MHFLANLCSQAHTTAARLFAVEDTSCPLTLNASDGEFRCISCPNPYSKCRARHSLLRELNLATVSQFTPRKKLHYDKIWKKGSELYKLRKKCRQNLIFFYVEANTLVEDISTSVECRGYQVIERYF
jgi:hypothetical protein